MQIWSGHFYLDKISDVLLILSISNVGRRYNLQDVHRKSLKLNCPLGGDKLSYMWLIHVREIIIHVDTDRVIYS